MIRYAAFLRGINVGGHKLIKMEGLSRIFTTLGLEKVATYIQSGNVVFESAEQDSRKLTGRIEKGLAAATGSEIAVFLRTLGELEALVSQEPFSGFESGTDVKKYVTFLAEAPEARPELPLVSPKKEIRVFRAEGREIFSLAFAQGNGRYGFPHSFIEKEFKVQATTRNWNTVEKIVKQK